MSDIQLMTKSINRFVDERNWRQFHNPKDSAISLALEAAELLEHFQWQNGKEIEEYVAAHKEEIADELADVLFWVLEISHNLGVDIVAAHENKLRKTAKKYPVEKSYANTRKYTEL